jgi:uncharacterized protein YllA (UPF0747 family)
LRPILADRLFPTVANLLGPSEVAYHAQLRSLYELLDVAQPVAVPRSGYTLLSEADVDLLERLDLPVAEAMSEGFDPSIVLARAASPNLSSRFEQARDGVRDALQGLREPLTDLDPGLEERWRQTLDHAGKGIDRLEDRARRADLGRRGISANHLQRLKRSLRPTGRPQERVLSFAHAVSQYGVEWIKRLPDSEPLHRFTHSAIDVRGGT